MIDYDVVKVGMTGENDYNNSRFLTAFMGYAGIEFDGVNEEEISIFVETETPNHQAVCIVGEGISLVLSSVNNETWGNFVQTYEDDCIYTISYLPTSTWFGSFMTFLRRQLVWEENLYSYDAYALEIGPVGSGGFVNTTTPPGCKDWFELQEDLLEEFLL